MGGYFGFIYQDGRPENWGGGGVLYTDYSRLSLNGHLCKTDTWSWSLPFFAPSIRLSIRRTASADPKDVRLRESWLYLTIIPRPRVGSKSIAHEGERNNCFSKIQLVCQKYRDKTTLASKTRFSRYCFGFQSRRFSLLVGYNI